MRRLLVPALPAIGVRVQAGPEASHHLMNVLRARPGDRLRLSDGAGTAAVGVFLGADEHGRALFTVDALLDAIRVPDRVVLLGLPKPALLEEALTLGAEGGATRFLLVRGRYSPPGATRPDRLERVLRAAVTQCGRPDLPAVHGPSSLEEALDEVPAGARWLAAPNASPVETPGTEEPATVAIGPEGGWSPDEVGLLQTAGFLPLGLGPFVLRTPSAVGAALARLWVG